MTRDRFIKVCGMRDASNIRAVEHLLDSSLHQERLGSVPLMGFIFWPKSSRCVSERPAYLPTLCKRVGVFVDASIEEIRQKVQEFDLNIIQLHGSESPAYIQLLRSGKESNGKSSDCLIIKAFNIATTDDFSQTVAYEGIADYFLFDTKGKSVGGNGEKFNWSVLAGYTGNTPFLLSGGIGPDDAELVKAFQHPKCLGIDLNSRFEIAPALKDVAALRRFLTLLTP